MEASGDNPERFLRRHMCGDWGEVDDGDKAANDRALKHNERLLSAYDLSDGTRPRRALTAEVEWLKANGH